VKQSITVVKMMLIDVVAMLLKVNCVDFWPLDKL